MVVRTQNIVTEDVEQDAITTTFLQQNFTPLAIDGNYFNEGGFFWHQTVQTARIIGDGFDYLFTFDVQLNISSVRSATETLQMETSHIILDADAATLVASQDETDYDGTGSNGTFIGGTGYAIGNTIIVECDSLLTVDNVAGGVVTEFTVTTPETGEDFLVFDTRPQISTSGSGVNFQLLPSDDNVVDASKVNNPFFTGQLIRYLSMLLTDVFTDRRRNINTRLTTLEDGVNYNFGTWLEKERSDGADSITGWVLQKYLSYLKVKR